MPNPSSRRYDSELPEVRRPVPTSADSSLDALLTIFERRRKPINTSFRDMFQPPATFHRITHDLHSYPAKLLVNIPSFFLSTTLSYPGETVLDPFCGSGTVLLEAMLAGRNAAGADANPLARLITQVKLTPIDPQRLRRARDSFFGRLPSACQSIAFNGIDLEYWFHPHVRRDLLRLYDTVSRTRDVQIRDLFRVTLSACVKKVSLADPRLSVPVRLRKNQYPEGHWLREPTNERLRSLRKVNVLNTFSEHLDQNIKRVEALALQRQLGRYLGLAEDARRLTHLKSNSVDLVITSPPYLGAQKYIRASSLSLTWLGFCKGLRLREFEEQVIGREHYLKDAYSTPASASLSTAELLLARIRRVNPLRAHIAAVYLCEMREAFREIARVLRPKRHVVLIIGASNVCGITFPTPIFLAQIAAAEGLSLRLHLIDAIRSRALMTKRNHTAGQIDAESIILLRKDA
ncbi:MAG: DNA methyltransferase [bacterium]